MINFEQYWATIKEDVKNKLQPGVIDLNAKAHEETHLINKPGVVANEINFFNQNNALDSSGALLGVCGSPDSKDKNNILMAGAGWDSHEKQYRNMGFNLNKTVICEMDKEYYWALLSNYLRRVMDIGVLSSVQNISTRSLTSHLSAEGVRYAVDPNINDLYYIQAPNHPALVWGAIKTGGVAISVKRSPQDFALSDTLGGLMSPSKVTHIDFDITMKAPNANYIVSEALDFYKYYKNVKSIVQVYSAQRGLNIMGNKIESEIDTIYNNQYSDIATKLRADKRSTDAVWELLYRNVAGSPQLVSLCNSLDTLYKQNKVNSLIQAYSGAGVKTMISIATTRPGIGGISSNIDIPATIGQSNINQARTFINKMIRSDRTKYKPQIDELEGIIKKFHNK